MIEIETTFKGRNIKITNQPEKYGAATREELAVFLTAQLSSTALQVLKKFQDKDLFPKNNFLTLVDNKLGLKETLVKPFGRIEYKRKLESLKPVLLFAFKSLLERSPQDKGNYKSNHVLFKNNILVARGVLGINRYIETANLTGEKDIFRFVNAAPYARKLERFRIYKQTQGRNKGQHTEARRKRGIVKGREVQIPSGVYILTTRAVKRKFKEIKTNIRFSFVPINPATAAKIDTTGKDTTGHIFNGKDRNGKPLPGNGRPYLYPSLTISAVPQAVSFNRGFTEDGF